MGKGSRWIAWLWVLAPSLFADPSFKLEYRAQGRVLGVQGEGVTFTVDVVLTSTSLDPSVKEGALGWSLSAVVGQAQVMAVPLCHPPRPLRPEVS